MLNKNRLYTAVKMAFFACLILVCGETKAMMLSYDIGNDIKGCTQFQDQLIKLYREKLEKFESKIKEDKKELEDLSKNLFFTSNGYDTAEFIFNKSMGGYTNTNNLLIWKFKLDLIQDQSEECNWNVKNSGLSIDGKMINFDNTEIIGTIKLYKKP